MDRVTIFGVAMLVAIAATASWYALRDYVKLQLEYRHRMELHGPNLANDAVIAGVQISF